MKKAIRIKNEAIFTTLSPVKVEPNEEGRKQFFREQSLGEKPDNPDAYFNCLVLGKRAADWLTEEYRKAFLSGKGDWWGLLQLWMDWEGKRFILPYLLSWHKASYLQDKVFIKEKGLLNLPVWIDKEISRDELRERYSVCLKELKHDQ